MKKVFLITLNLLIIMMSASFSQNYDWKDIENAFHKQLPRKAEKLALDILHQAQTNKYCPAQIKATIFIINAYDQYREQPIIDAINLVKKQKTQTPECLTFKNAILGYLYYAYYLRHRWEILDRTDLSAVNDQDIRTWTVSNFAQAINNYFSRALKTLPLLKKYKAQEYGLLFHNGSAPSALRPSVFDQVTQWIIEFYKDNDLGLVHPKNYFQINDPIYFLPPDKFSQVRIKTNDTLSSDYNVLRIFQIWEREHLRDKDKEALVDIYLQRLNFVHDKYQGNDRDQLYVLALKKLQLLYPRTQRTSMAYYLQATYFFENADASDSLKADYLVKAVRILRKMLGHYKNNDITAEALTHGENLLSSIEKENIGLESETPLAPVQAFPILIKYRNLGKIYLHVYKIDESLYYSDTYSKDKLAKSLTKPLIYEKTIQLDDPGDYYWHSTEFIIPGLKPGKYAIVLSQSSKFDKDKDLMAYSFVNVSAINLTIEKTFDRLRIIANDRLSGSPIKGLVISITPKSYGLDHGRTQKINCNSQGIAEFQLPGSRSWATYTIEARKGESEIRIITSGYKSSKPAYNAYKRAVVFLDRKIYRPGQTVFFKGLVYETNNRDYHKALKDYNVHIVFYDINGAQVGQIDTRTDKYGGFNGQFIIPAGRATGMWRMEIGILRATNFRVEEYKRPQFFVKFDTLSQAFVAGEKVILTGHATNYNGIALNNATVEYSIKKRVGSFWLWWWTRPEEFVVGSGTTQTDANGMFTINVETDPHIEKGKIAEYIINAKVTDLNGETHSATTSFRVANQSVFIKINTDQWLNLSRKHTFSVIIKNVQDKELTGLKAQYKIVKLIPPRSHPLLSRLWDRPDKPLYSQEQWHKLLPLYEYVNEADPSHWQDGKVIRKGTIISGEKFALTLPGQGVYRAIVRLTDPKTGETVTEKQLIYAFDSDSNKALAPIAFYASLLGDKYHPGQTAEILIGSGWTGAHVFYQITWNGKITQEKYLKLSASQAVLSIPISEDMMGGFAVNVLIVKNNRAFSKKITVPVLFPDKKLKISVTGLEHKVAPGQKISFKVKITDSQGNPVVAELLASAYDASLDAFARNIWRFSLSQVKNITHALNITGINSTTDSWTINQPTTYVQTIIFSYPTFDWYRFNLSWGGHYPRKLKGKEMPTMAMEAEIKPKETAPTPVADNITEQEPDLRNIILRKDMRETAFFYPALTTDNNGVATIQFRIPDALTKWRLQIFANTPELDYGLISKEIVTVKPLMVYPNLPRFFRQGDTVMLSTKIVNNSTQNENIHLRLVIKDALNNQLLTNALVNEGYEKTITLSPTSSGMANWQIIIPSDLINPLEITIIAQSSKYSDAQQNIIPVLSNRVLVTETMPMPVGPMRSKTFVFDRLVNPRSSTAQNYRYEIEFNSNPVWYALVAIPYMMQYPYECNEQLFSRFYANTLASFILNSAPQIKHVFELWQKQGAQALKSPLEKKQELKQIILEETPWLMEGKNETENTARLSLLFDLNHMAYEQQEALRKLLERQNPDGGWPWFSGMHSSWFVTQHILIGFARLKNRNVYDYTTNHQLKSSITQAIYFTDRQAIEYYNNLKKWIKPEDLNKNHLSPQMVHYLYMRSMYQNIKLKSHQAFDYFMAQAKKYWTSLNLYTQAMAAITLANYGNTQTAEQILASIRDRALEDKEIGVYWAENKPGWYWYQAPIETQSMLIQAFNQIKHDTTFVEKMKIWLLKNKQTNSWETTKATTEAVYALVFTGYNWLAENKPVKITIAGHTYPDRQTKTEAGTGYFQKIWTDGQIKPELGKIRVNNPNHHPTWGAAYWQYFEEMDKVQSASAGVAVDRKYFLVKRDARGEHLEPITDGEPIQVGDELVVRIILTVSRPMEFVHLKDMRAASFEPKEQLSGYHWKGGIGYYQSIRDASASFFIDYINKGRYVFEYRVYATMAGQFSAGFATFQCMYAPEFSAHSNGMRVIIKKQ